MLMMPSTWLLKAATLPASSMLVFANHGTVVVNEFFDFATMFDGKGFFVEKAQCGKHVDGAGRGGSNGKDLLRSVDDFQLAVAVLVA